MKTFGDTQRSCCPVCDAADIKPLWAIPFTDAVTPVCISGAFTSALVLLDLEAAVYKYSICDHCGSIFQNPYDVQCKASVRASSVKEGLPSNAAAYKDNFVRWMHPYMQPGHAILLDAACGVAEYTRLAAQMSQWRRLLATDLSEACVKRIGKMLPDLVQAWVMDLDTDSFKPEDKCDFIIFAEAAEHVLEPARVIRKLAQQLAPRGRIYWSMQATEGKLPVRPGEPIYASRAGITRMLVAAGLAELCCELDAGRFRVIAERA